VKRREFITLLGGAAAAWPLAARAQQSPPALIGFLYAGAATTMQQQIDAFRDGLRNLGHIEGRNVRFEYRFADGYLDKLPALAAELVRLNPNVVVSSPVPANLAIAGRLRPGESLSHPCRSVRIDRRVTVPTRPMAHL
jgi:putative tryptophan/tyrosine transport system substrate-binding protein